MRVLWITNALLPEAVAYLTGSGESNSTGSWICALADRIVSTQLVDLGIVATSNLVKELRRIDLNYKKYYVFPKMEDEQKYTKKYDTFWKKIYNEFQPEVIHIHGTERPLGLSYVRACGRRNVVVSIQGLVSDISHYYFAGLSKMDVLRNITIHDVLRRSDLVTEYKKIKYCGKYEIELLRSIDHVIGRTTWDRAHCMAINNSLTYYHCNEILRNEFYESKWDYNKCEKYSIFLTQAGYPLKGAHNLIRAVALVRQKYPSVKLSIAGRDMINNSGLKGFFTKQTYGSILKKLIRKLGLDDVVTFIGPQNAAGMKYQLLKANVFVSPSSIENSPNSIGEAQMLGVPVIASFVGGVPDFIPSKQYGWVYRFEDYEMLAYMICQCFEKSSSFDYSKMIELAKKRHDIDTNLANLISIYNKVAEEKYEE